VPSAATNPGAAGLAESRFHLAFPLMPAETYQAWLSLYLGVAILAGVTALMALAKTIYDVRTNAVRFEISSWRGRILLLPRLWLRWQLNYLQGTSTILAIAVLYAHHLGFCVLGNV
jgi:hypothetical protein